MTYATAIAFALRYGVPTVALILSLVNKDIPGADKKAKVVAYVVDVSNGAISEDYAGQLVEGLYQLLKAVRIIKDEDNE